ncbi:MAG: transcription elongation factor GreA [bacterium]|nr:transcription elongation factor GreA [bacterium]
MSTDIEAKKKKLKDELEKLKYEFKVQLPKIISTAREFGDLKENAEYHAARERQSFVKALISQLTEQLSQLNELDLASLPKDRIGYGSTVTILDLDTNDEIVFTFVSSNEVNPSEGKISLSSPIGVALGNKTAGDEVEASIPAGVRKYYIKKLVTVHGNEIEKERE